jgi:hypothetical protein
VALTYWKHGQVRKVIESEQVRTHRLENTETGTSQDAQEKRSQGEALTDWRV